MNELRGLIVSTLYALLTHPDALTAVLDSPRRTARASGRRDLPLAVTGRDLDRQTTHGTRTCTASER